MPRMTIHKEFTFDSAHFLPHVPAGHKCHNMHGHTYVVEVHAEGEIDSAMGWVLDFDELEQAVRPLIKQLDHKLLNEMEGLENPTAENLALWLWNRIRPGLSQIARVVVKETPGSVVSYSGR